MEILTIPIFTQRRDRARAERLAYIGISLLEIFRAGLKFWEDKKRITISYMKEDKNDN